MQTRNEWVVRAAIASLLALAVAALFVVLLMAARPVKPGAEASPTKPHNPSSRERIHTSAAIPCEPLDGQCFARWQQISKLDQTVKAGLLQTEVDLLQIESYAKTNDHRVQTLWANYWASWIVLAMVIVIVGTGLYMSFLQLQRDLTTDKPHANSFKFSKDGLEINSPVIGLLIFLASTYFFTLYVEKIYPVTFLSVPTEKDQGKVDIPQGDKTDTAR